MFRFLGHFDNYHQTQHSLLLEKRKQMICFTSKHHFLGAGVRVWARVRVRRNVVPFMMNEWKKGKTQPKFEWEAHITLNMSL